MTDLVGDRFVRAGASWMDLATGRDVRIRLAPLGPTDRQLSWNDRCATLSRLRHPLVSPLLDYGVADARRTFEAYLVLPPIAAAGRAGSELLTHAARFLESNGLPLTRDQADLTLRSLWPGGRSVRGRPIGLVLQPRRALTRLSEALDELDAGGPVMIAIHGESGCGLRTLRTMAARAARLSGFLPLGSAAIKRWPGCGELARERHVCLMVGPSPQPDEARAAAALVADLGLASARGHAVLLFSRSARSSANGSIEVDAMGTKALSTMVFVDSDRGPSPADVWEAARQACGSPGRFLTGLQAARFGEASRATLTVHETRPSYVVHEAAEPAVARRSTATRRLGAAALRAARLAARGRHASAVRLLTRALRVLEARGQRALAAECALQLAWTFRSRGRSREAAAQFERARALAVSEVERLRAATGLGIVWTDDGRLAEAEALLRAAHSAARLIASPELDGRIGLALGRNLVWQRRYDQALILITRAPDGGTSVEAHALRSRIHIGLSEPRLALASAAEAVRLAATERDRAAAARALAAAQSAAGDTASARVSARRGLADAARAHLPLLSIRLRSQIMLLHHDGAGSDLSRLVGWARSALRRPLPALYRTSLEEAIAATTVAPEPPCPPSDASLSHLRSLLELAHGATDDRAALQRVAADLVARLRAATIVIVDASADPDVFVRAGRPWPSESELITRALAGGRARDVDAAGGLVEAAAVVRYGDESIGVVACRWTVGTSVDGQRAGATLDAAALAVAPSLRALLDRRNMRLPDCRRDELIGCSAPMVALRDAVARAARAPFPVLVEGESGSGKELVARAIHRLSPRRDRRLCAVNCAALTDDLLEAELFGHARGAYTGAVGERPGLFEEADGGTLFLDEVGELSARAQAKLLRVLQDGEVRRVGENLPRRVDTRVVAATNRCLAHEADSGRFRVDLRYRLDVIRIHVPPLRERATDVPALAAHFWEESTRRLGSGATLTADTLAVLARYQWPGNVRELQNVIASIAVHSPRRGRVTPATLPFHIARATPDREVTFEAARFEFERRFVSAALARAGGRRTGAARALGVSRQGLTKMMRRLRIEGTDSS